MVSPELGSLRLRGREGQDPFRATAGAALLLVVPLLAACAGRTPADAPRPEHFNHDYEFTGSIGGQHVSGTIEFLEHDVYPLEYTLSSERGTCRNRLRSLAEPRIYLNCRGLFIEFVRGGQVMERATATLRTTRSYDRRECARWVEHPQARTRTCEVWRSVPVEEPVTYDGWVDIRRAVGTAALTAGPG